LLSIGKTRYQTAKATVSLMISGSILSMKRNEKNCFKHIFYNDQSG
jgi:hypothetical protein